MGNTERICHCNNLFLHYVVLEVFGSADEPIGDISQEEFMAHIYHISHINHFVFWFIFTLVPRKMEWVTVLIYIRTNQGRRSSSTWPTKSLREKLEVIDENFCFLRFIMSLRDGFKKLCMWERDCCIIVELRLLCRNIVWREDHIF